MKILVSALLLLGFLSACMPETMNHGLAADGMTADDMAMDGDMAMDDGMESMSGG